MAIRFTVNGKKCTVDMSMRRDTSLNAYLRYHLGLPGTKAMCHEGGCGSCIVKVRARRYPSGLMETFSVNSCLVLVFSCQNWEITTIEGLGNRRDGYSDIQKRVVAMNATQCGYCTPGWVMHLSSLVDKNMTMAELERSFASNTCRCTGFRPIMDTVKSFATDASPELLQTVKDIEDLKICNKTKEECQRRCSAVSSNSDWSLLEDWEDKKNLCSNENSHPVELNFGENKFFKVVHEDEIFSILSKEGVSSYMLVDGNTGKGVYETFEYPRVLIDISGVASLKSYQFDQNLILGANMSLQDCIKLFKNTSKTDNYFSYLEEFATHFDLIANMPVRKLGSLAGNLMLKHEMPSYQSDVFLLFEAVDATISVRDARGDVVSLTLPQFLKYDMVGKLLFRIELPPLNNTSHIFKSYKIMPRSQNALAIVNAAFLVKFSSHNKTIDNINIVYGNISSDFVHAKNTENYLRKKNLFKNDILSSAVQVLKNEIVPAEKPPYTSPECRKKLAIGLFYKFALSICPTTSISTRNRSGGSLIQRPISKGTQNFQKDCTLYPLNQPVPKLEGLIQSSGEAQYANDIPPMRGEVFGAFVLSTIHVGEIDKIDASEVCKMDGVLRILTAKDIPGKNSFILPGIPLETEEEEILSSGPVKFYGQPVAIVVAISEDLAAKVAKKVKVTYKNVSTGAPVLTIDQAKKESKRYAAGDATIEPTTKGDNLKKVIKGVYEIEAQYHYYIEPMTCVVVPVDNIFEVYDSSQWVDLTQISIAQCLNVKESDVLIKIRRIGGGFGGKISRNAQVAAACGLVAKKMGAPCRFVLPMQTNMAIAGRRLPCQCEYEVGVDDDGKIQYLNATIVEDDGCSHNENILSYTVGGFKNCYNTENFSLKTASVLTDLASNTFARAPGTGEGIACIEHIMEHIAFAVKKDPTSVRLANMRTEDNDLPTLIKEFKKETDYEKRVKEIEQFNEANRWKKKGISINVMSFPIAFYGNYSAMVSIYRDGSITVTSGGIEMGQGLNTKVAQVCAYELGVPLHYVTVIPTQSFSCANNVFSGSSITTESVCYATIRACNMLNKRLEALRIEMMNPTWEELAQKAGEKEIDLTAIYMMTEKEEDLKSYYSYGVAISEILLDVLTGRYEIMRVDILEDVGLSPNPLLDCGQLEGGYVQGMGYFTTEKMVYDKKTGKTLTNRSLTYHVPLALDIPADFNIKFRYNSKNPRGVLGAKTVGEMGIGTAHGITHCLRKCIHASRKDSGHDPEEWINIDTPYDTESIIKALDAKLEEFTIS